MIGTLVMTLVGRLKMRRAWPPITISDTRLSCCRPSPLHIYSAWSVSEMLLREKKKEERLFPQNIFSHNLMPYPSGRPSDRSNNLPRPDGRTDGLPFRSLSSSVSSSSRGCSTVRSLVPVVLERAYFKSILGMS